MRAGPILCPVECFRFQPSAPETKATVRMPILGTQPLGFVENIEKSGIFRNLKAGDMPISMPIAW